VNKQTFGIGVAAALFLACTMSGRQDAQSPPPKLSLVIVHGADAINNIKLRTSRETIVQVEDENHRPVAGAAVVFLLPGSGPGGTFPNGAASATVTTNASGQAQMPRMTPNQAAGQFQIHVTATYQGATTTIEIAQSNVLGAAGAGAGAAAGSGKLIAILAGVGAAAAAGAVVAMKGGKNSTSTSTSTVPSGPGGPSGTISAGSGGAGFGPPH
jgi:hypothetical protein